MPVTYTGKGGVPYLTPEAAAASYGSSASTGNVTYTDPRTGQTYLSERQMILDQERQRKERGW